eukprot:2078553-Pyramimonas_sp.AAC.1
MARRIQSIPMGGGTTVYPSIKIEGVVCRRPAAGGNCCKTRAGSDRFDPTQSINCFVCLPGFSSWGTRSTTLYSSTNL